MKTNVNLNNLYTIYVNARTRFWNIHDKTAPADRKTSAAYQKALRVRERAWENYANTRRQDKGPSHD